MQPQLLYAGSISVTRDEDHIYYVTKDGETTSPDSVTTALNIVNKPGLVQWSANQCADWLLRQEPWTQTMNEEMWRLAANRMRTEFRRTSKKATDTGWSLHDCIHHFLIGDTVPTPDPLDVQRPYLRFLQWHDEHKPETLASSRYIYHLSEDYVGELDWLMRLHGLRRVVDFKTNARSKSRPSGIYPENHYQTAAYASAYDLECGDETTQTTILRFGKDGTFDSEDRNEMQVARDFAVFRHLCRANQAMKRAEAA